MSEMIFLKLGGSLITQKDQPLTPRVDVIARLSGEIAAAKKGNPGLRLVLGHGSGSFGHTPAKKHGTRQGVKTAAEWQGFHEVWLQAGRLNHLVIDGLRQAGIAAMSFPISTGARASKMEIISWELKSLNDALDNGILPVVYGDVVFDDQLGGTILSTEDIFRYLTRKLNPKKIFLAGLEPGVWADYPERSQLVETITPENFNSIASTLEGSAQTDVTGGMRNKVQQMLELVAEFSDLEIFIFSGEDNQITTALRGKPPGTKISK